MEQSKNKVEINGVLLESKFEEKVSAGGKDFISGNLVIRVEQKKGEVSEVPVRLFAMKKTKKDTINPAFASIQKASQDFTSLATINEKNLTINPTYVKIKSGNLAENSYVSKNGQLTSYGIVQAAFVEKSEQAIEKDKAKFEADIIIISVKDEADKAGELTGNLVVKGGIIQWGDKIDVVDFVVTEPNAINFINQHWNQADTVSIAGNIEYTSEQIESAEEKASYSFGKVEPSVYNKNIKRFVITAGSEPRDAESAYDKADLKRALADRKVKQETMVEEAKKKQDSNSDDLDF